MTDEAIEAGARVLRQSPPSTLTQDVRAAAVAAWPVLSAPLRELHSRWNRGGGRVACGHCNDYTEPVRKSAWPCPTMQAVLATDKELGIGDDHQSGDPS